MPRMSGQQTLLSLWSKQRRLTRSDEDNCSESQSEPLPKRQVDNELDSPKDSSASLLQSEDAQTFEADVTILWRLSAAVNQEVMPAERKWWVDNRWKPPKNYSDF